MIAVHSGTGSSSVAGQVQSKRWEKCGVNSQLHARHTLQKVFLFAIVVQEPLVREAEIH
jgi:hypothetical protein